MSEDPAPETNGQRDAPGVIAPPPVIFGGSLAIGVLLDLLLPSSILPQGIQYIAGFAVIAVSLVVMALAIIQFLKAGTNLDVRKPATTVVTSGPFRVSRNPMYVSLAMLYVGIGIAADSPWIVGLLLPALIAMRYGVIRPEERYLERKFGEDYLRYKRAVRRWI